MAYSCSTTTTMTAEEWQQYLDEQVAEEAKNALKDETSSGPVMVAIEYFIKWLRDRVTTFFTSQLKRLPVIGRWASRISMTVSEICFTVIGTLLGFLKTIFTAPTLWKKAHRAAMAAWDANEDRGLLAQTYAYSRKMSSYFLEIIKQCLEGAIRAHRMELSIEERVEIAEELDNLIPGTDVQVGILGGNMLE